jgi:hypothetical protein
VDMKLGGSERQSEHSSEQKNNFLHQELNLFSSCPAHCLVTILTGLHWQHSYFWTESSE